MPAVASIVITVDEKGAVTALNRIDAAGKQIDPGLQKIGQRGNVVLTQIESQSKKSAQAMQLLANITGVQMPRALEQVLSKAPGVASALNAAFAATVVITLAKEVLNLVDNLTGYSEQLAKIQAQSTAIIDSVAQSNKTLLGPQTFAQINKQILDTAKGVDALNQHFGLTGDAFGDALKRGMARYSASESILLDQLDHEKDLLNQLGIKQAELRAQREHQDVITILQQENQAREAGLEGIAAIERAEKDRVNEAIVGGRLLAENEKVTQATIVAIHADANARKLAYQRSENDETRRLAEQSIQTQFKGIELVNVQERDSVVELDELLKRKLISIDTYNQRRGSIEFAAANQRKEIERQAIEQTTQAEEDAAVAIAAPWDRSNVQIRVDAERRIRSIQQALKDSTISEQQAALQIQAVWQQTFAKMRDELAGQLESLFDDLTSGNIGKRFLDNFKKLVFQMAASWLLGLRQMQSSSQVSFGGSGGILGTLLGGVFGVGGLGGGGGSQGGISNLPGVITNFSGSGGGGILGGIGSFFGLSSGSSAGSVGGASIGNLPLSPAGNIPGGIPGLALSTGLGAGSGTVLPAGASSAIGFGAGAAGLAGRLAGLQAMAGLSLFGLAGKAGPGGGAALGALGGLLTGGGLIAMFPAILGLLGPATLGISAAIGAIVGLISGIFGSGKRQRAVEQLGQQIKDNIKSVEDAYNSHQVDFDPAISQLESLRTDAMQKMHSLGGSTRARVQIPIDDAESRMKATEAERQRRLAISFGPAQFRVGGYVSGSLGSGYPAGFGASALHYATGGEVPAILHSGEFVMRPEAVSRIGVGPLQQMNAGGGLGDVHIHGPLIQAEKIDEAWLRNGGTAQIARALQRANREGLRI